MQSNIEFQAALISIRVRMFNVFEVAEALAKKQDYLT